MRFQRVVGLGGCISICELFFEVKTRVSRQVLTQSDAWDLIGLPQNIPSPNIKIQKIAIVDLVSLFSSFLFLGVSMKC